PGVGRSRVVSEEEQKRGRLQRFLNSLDLHTRSGRRRTALLAAALPFVILAAITFTRIQASSGPSGFANGNNLRQSVAVLGFKNLSGEAQRAWLSPAFSDWLMAGLTAGERVRTIPAESVARMKTELSLTDVDSVSAATLLLCRKQLGTDCVVV